MYDDCSNGTNAKQESNPFEEEEWDEDGGEPLIDNGEPGVPVRALYDYEGAEADELSFKQGTLHSAFRKIAKSQVHLIYIYIINLTRHFSVSIERKLGV